MAAQLLGLVVVDSDGNRIAVKYAAPVAAFGHKDFVQAKFGDYAGQTKFEALMASKVGKLVSRNEVEVLATDECTVLFRPANDVYIFVVGPLSENELILAEVVNAIYQALVSLTSNQVTKRTLLESLDLVYLVLDEVMDGSAIFETNPSVIAGRVQMQEGASLQEPTETAVAFNQALTNARDNLLRSFLSG